MFSTIPTQIGQRKCLLVGKKEDWAMKMVDAGRGVKGNLNMQQQHTKNNKMKSRKITITIVWK